MYILILWNDIVSNLYHMYLYLLKTIMEEENMFNIIIYQ